MAKLLALDWDRLEARIIIAHGQGGKVVVDQVTTMPLQLDTQEMSAADVGEQLRAALASGRFPKCQALAAVGRAQVELRVLKLPPAPEDELPEMVRFQGMREFSSLKEDSPLDFVPLGDSGEEPGEVMAAAIPSDFAQSVSGAFAENGQELRRLILRPCAATSLALRRCAVASSANTLVISQQADAAELAIIKQGTVVFTRSVRLPENWHPGESGEPLLGEVRRTIAAAQNQLGGSRVKHIVLFGTEPEHGDLSERLQQRTQLDVELIDPFADIRLNGTKPDQPERFAALLGMLEDEVAETPPVIDFVNPRKTPEPESNQRLHLLLAATAATVLLAIVAFGYQKYSEKGSEISRLKFEIRQLDEGTLRLKEAVELADSLRKWKAADRNWLDELLHLSTSEELSAEDFRIDSIGAVSFTGRPGKMTLRGRAKDFSATTKLENELSDDSHEVLPGRSSRSGDDERYPIIFRSEIVTRDSIPIVPAKVAKQDPQEQPTGQDSAEAGASS